MCELLGLSLKREGTPSISFRAFRGRARGDTPGNANPHGWGIAWYPDGRAVSLIKEEIPANESALASFIGQYGRLCSRTFIAHVRKASRGGVTYRNTHPFCRELNGCEYTFAHNGTLRGDEGLDLGPFRPVGETDSERLFCYLLNVLRKDGGIDSENFPRLLKALSAVNELSEGGEEGKKSKMNILLTDGDTLLAYRDMYRKGTLYRLERPEHYCEDAAILEDGDYRIKLSVEKGPEQCAAVIATKKLTDEPGWKEIKGGELCAFRRGKLIFSSKAKTSAAPSRISNAR